MFSPVWSLVLLLLAPADEAPAPEAALRVRRDGPDRWTAALEVRLPEGWHTYWMNPGDSGLASAVALAGAGAIGAVRWPGPVLEQAAGGLRGYAYEGVAAWFWPVEGAAGGALRAEARLLLCRDTCVVREVRADGVLRGPRRLPASLRPLEAAVPTAPGAGEPDWVAHAGGWRLTVPGPAAAFPDLDLESSAQWSASPEGAVVHFDLHGDAPRGALTVQSPLGWRVHPLPR